jgi:hypothetical protein
MANAEIILTNDDGVLVPNLPSVQVISGNTITIATSDGSPAAIFFSPAAAAVLAPTPTFPYVLDAGAKFSASFLSSEPGEYSVFFETSASVTPPQFPVAKSELLLLEIDSSGTKFGSPDSNMKKG